jgi:hypothetical protein
MKTWRLSFAVEFIRCATIFSFDWSANLDLYSRLANAVIPFSVAGKKFWTEYEIPNVDEIIENGNK